MDHNYLVLAFYHLTPIENPEQEAREHHAFFAHRDIASRIYLAAEGINGQMSASKEAAQEYMEWMHSRPAFKDVVFKIHTWHEHVFPRKSVKPRKQLVAIDVDVDLDARGEHVSPAQWKEMMETTPDRILLDIRNDYEWEVGRFAGAERPNCNTFRDFKTFTENLIGRVNTTDTPVMMYCTGGIRCEIYSAYLKQKGFEKIYQLDGGVIGYGLNEGSKHWEGKLFVFDDRMTVPISDEEAPIVGQCKLCNSPTENYYNCANMDCNELFLCCSDCLTKLSGCCCEACSASPRVRPFHHQNPHKPFRKYHHYFGEKKKAPQVGK